MLKSTAIAATASASEIVLRCLVPFRRRAVTAPSLVAKDTMLGRVIQEPLVAQSHKVRSQEPNGVAGPVASRATSAAATSTTATSRTARVPPDSGRAEGPRAPT